MDENDNRALGAHTLWAGSDPHGQAAMLLVESLLHGLVAQSIITVNDAVDIVELAADVKMETGPELGDSPEMMQKSLHLLAAIRSSLNGDLPNDAGK